MESISDIKNKLSETDDESLPLVMSLYIGDERAGVQNVPITNYGTAIAYMNGILKRSLEIFPDLAELI